LKSSVRFFRKRNIPGFAVKKLLIECDLDLQYQALYEAAMQVAASYLQLARAAALSSETEIKVHFLISVRVRTPGSWSATWAKSIWVHDNPKSLAIAGKTRKGGNYKVGRSHMIDLPKGKSHAYPAKTFRSLPAEIRDIAIYHEDLLSELRKAGAENRLLRRSYGYNAERVAKVISRTEAALQAANTAADTLVAPVTDETAET